MPSESEMEPDVVELDGAALRARGKPGPPSHFTCPDCGGTLFQLNERELLQFRCRTGHAYSAGTLMAQQSEVQEEALWAAIRSLEERGELMHQMATKARQGNRNLSAERYQVMALEAQQRADLIRQALFQGQLPVTAMPEATEQEQENGRSNSPSTPRFKVVVLIASAGGRKSLSQILPALPQNFPAAAIVMQHLDTQSDASWTAETANSTTIPSQLVKDGEQLQPGNIYIAPPTRHLLVNPDGTLSLSQAIFVDFIRPSLDLLLQSVAATFKERAIAVVLSGTERDGVLGVQAIHKMGGQVIVQDESTSEFFEMPNAAIQTGNVNLVLPLDAIASTLINLVEV